MGREGILEVRQYYKVMREDLLAKSISGKRMSKCKGPEVKECLKNSKEASLPGAERAE